MSYLIIVFIVLLALAPLLHFAPSKRQRRQAALREHAALQGLFVEFRELPEGVAARSVGNGGNTIYYGLRLPPAKRGEARSGSWMPTAEGWRPVGRRLPVPGALQNLPATAEAVSLDNGSCGVYWRETGNEEDIDQFKAVLDAWAAAL